MQPQPRSVEAHPAYERGVGKFQSRAVHPRGTTAGPKDRSGVM
jgi:hypothetical protein